MTQNRIAFVSILLRFILPITILSIVLLTVFRLIFLSHFYEDFTLLFRTKEALNPILIKGMAKGFRYDAIVVSYVMALPILASFISWIFNFKTRRLMLLLKTYIVLVFALVFAIACVDFPYFKYFWSHPTRTIFDWLGFGGTYGMLFGESSYYPYYFLYLITLTILIGAVIVCSRWVVKSKFKYDFWNNVFLQSLVFACALVACFFGTRGQLSTIQLDSFASYFADKKLVSDLCITPAFHFMSQLDDYQVDFPTLMDEEKALSYVQTNLQIDANQQKYENPISRDVLTDSTLAANDYNVVLVLMESMSAALLHQTIDGKSLTPFLDSLTQSSFYFENIYSSGIHTNAGVGSTLLGYPSRLNEHMMGRNPLSYNNIVKTLKDEGYETLFFMPHEEEYDNMGLFLRTNHFNKIYSDRNYPKEALANYFGVPDKYLFNFALEEINTISQNKQPFFSTILTVSNHPPYVVPAEYAAVSENKEIAILRYVDDCIKEFMQKASEQEWYKNTIFVFFGDHGKLVGSPAYAMPLSYNHIPLIIYCPQLADSPQVFEGYGGQMDILPTVMGILNKSYVNSTLGIDLRKEKRPYTVFTTDTHIGCINDTYFYIFNPKEGKEELYLLKEKTAANSIDSNQGIALQMQDYAVSILTTAHYLENTGLVEK